MAKNKCLSCGGQMRFSLAIHFKIEQVDSDLMMSLLEPRSNEGVFPLDVYICPGCGKIELRAGKEIKNALLRFSSGKRAISR